MTPAVVIRPILLASSSVNQRLPSGPAAIPAGRCRPVGMGNSVMTPAVVIRPIWLPRFGEPEVAVRPGRDTSWSAAGRGDRESVMTPAVVIRPIWLHADSVNQRLPSGPAAMPTGPLPAVGMGNSVMTPAGVIRPICWQIR